MLGRIVLSSVCAVALSAAANGADIYGPAPIGPGGYKDACCAPLWTGFYVGVNGGYGWGDPKSKLVDMEVSPTPAEITKRFMPAGGFGGGQIGYNWQRGHLLFGLEADIQGAGIHGDAATSLGIATASGSTDLDWFGTVRGRLGYAWGGTLLYATGGFAYGGIHDKLTKADPTFGSLSRSEVATGYVVGGGLEYVLSPAWSLKAEYQFIELGKDTLSLDAVVNPVFLAELDAHHSYNTVRIGVNYHFLPSYEPLK